jgi:hypothetical protein
MVFCRRGFCSSGIGLAWKRRKQGFASHRTRRADRATRALSVAMPVLAYIWRYSFEMNKNAKRALNVVAQRDRFHMARKL